MSFNYGFNFYSSFRFLCEAPAGNGEITKNLDVHRGYIWLEAEQYKAFDPYNRDDKIKQM